MLLIDWQTFWSELWNTIATFFKNNAWNIVFFFALLVVGTIAIYLIIRGINAIFRKRGTDRMAARFIVSVIRFLLWLVLVLALLSIMGVSITGLTTAISAVVLAIGVALKDNVSNLANGLILISSKRYKNGDYVIVDGVEGSIVEISFLFTVLKTADGRQIMMPNGTFVNTKVINNGANPTRRVQFTFSVAYESDIEKVKKIVIDCMRSDGRVYLDPAPFCRLKTMSASSLDFFASCWVDNEDYWDVYYGITELVWNEFKRNGISVPFQQIEMRERKDEVVMPFETHPIPERVEKARKARKGEFSWEALENASPKDFLGDVQKTGERLFPKKEKKNRQKSKV